MDAKRRKRSEGRERKDRKGDGGKIKRRLGINKDNHGIEEETEKENKAKKGGAEGGIVQ